MSAVPNAFENVKAVILSAHKGTTSKEKVDFYNSWAENYDQDVAVLDYRAPRLAANSISSHFRGDREAAVLLDVACGTGLVARQLKNHGFGHFVGIDGSEAMLEVARESGLYQDLKQFLLGEEPLPVQWENAFDVVVIVGALSVGQVPVCVVRDLCKSTKPVLLCRSKARQYECSSITFFLVEAVDGGSTGSGGSPLQLTAPPPRRVTMKPRMLATIEISVRARPAWMSDVIVMDVVCLLHCI
uniref:Methyltransferase like 27 n=1 Tax=Acanthochromis polyacanthus TaxID=80966 RepID=A0A3Q1GR28_9TELE